MISGCKRHFCHSVIISSRKTIHKLKNSNTFFRISDFEVFLEGGTSKKYMNRRKQTSRRLALLLVVCVC
jgi:hypothetical protein